MPLGEVQVPQVTTPTGGGAVRGIDEKFAVTAATGTAGFSVTVPVPPGRGAVHPAFALSYDSSAGNGPFGLGWRLDVPVITRKLADGVPRYDDDRATDTFVLAGSEDLVPAVGQDGAPLRTPRTVHGVDYLGQRYRPRVDVGRDRIERWQRVDDGTSHWRATTRDAVTTVLGETPSSRVADPANPHRCAAWLPDRVHDDRGNVAVYEHAVEDGAGVDDTAAHEAGRRPADRTAQRYPRRVRWVGATPYHPDLSPDGAPTPLPADWAFELVLDYGDLADGPQPEQPWPVRPDPFSTYREGFEVRTYRPFPGHRAPSTRDGRRRRPAPEIHRPGRWQTARRDRGGRAGRGGAGRLHRRPRAAAHPPASPGPVPPDPHRARTRALGCATGRS